MRVLTLASISAVMLTAACTAPTQHPVATSGSKSDATVTLTAEFSPNGERPRWGDAQNTAEDRCRAWGYIGAEPLGSIFQSCQLVGSLILSSCQQHRSMK